MFLGVNVTFFPQHFLGLAGIPRRYSVYADVFFPFNYVSRLGSSVSLGSLLFFLWILYESIAFKRALIFSGARRTEIEWGSRGYPRPHHSEPQRHVSYLSKGPAKKFYHRVGKMGGKFKKKE